MAAQARGSIFHHRLAADALHPGTAPGTRTARGRREADISVPTPSAGRTRRDRANDRTRADWLATALLSGAASIWAVRAASAAAVDEPLTALLVFVVIPALLLLLVTAFPRPAVLFVAAALPFAWLALVVESSDSAAVWLVPVAGALGLMAVARLPRGGPARPTAVLCALALALTAATLPAPAAPDPGTRLVLVGVDGATWERIDALVEDGRLPQISHVLEDGHRARLRSLKIMSSPRIWSSVATGCLPDVHGIIDWNCTQSDFRVGRIWDQLLLEGRSVGVLNWYFTWPPPDWIEDPSFIIPSSLAPDGTSSPREYSFLWKLRAREGVRGQEDIALLPPAVSALKHGARLSTLRRSAVSLVRQRAGGGSGLEHAWTGRRLSMALQTDVFAEALRTRRPEFAAILLNQVDYVSHFYWKYSSPELFSEVTAEDVERYGEAVDDIYVETDACLARILAVLPEGADVMIVSDHGFRPAVRKTAGRYCRIRTERLTEVLGVEDAVFGTNLGNEVLLRPTVGSEEEQAALLDRLQGILSDVHLATEQKPLFGVARDGTTLILSVRSRDAIPEDASIDLAGVEYPFDELIVARPEARISGEHAPDGVYLLAGPSAVRAADTDSLSVLDVAPTVASILDLPISPLWTGRSAVAYASTGVRSIEPYAPPRTSTKEPAQLDERLKDQLRTLGYLE